VLCGFGFVLAPVITEKSANKYQNKTRGGENWKMKNNKKGRHNDEKSDDTKSGESFFAEVLCGLEGTIFAMEAGALSGEVEVINFSFLALTMKVKGCKSFFSLLPGHTGQFV
jgi:hypothetical protein